MSNVRQNENQVEWTAVS